MFIEYVLSCIVLGPEVIVVKQKRQKKKSPFVHVVGVDNFIYQFICIVLEENVEENEERMMYRDCLE